MPSDNFVIVGGGLAAAKAAEALREQQFGGPIVLIGDERHRPYERPPLSKDLLLGKAEADSVYVHDESWYGEHEVDLRLGTAVTAVDRDAHEVRLDDGSTVAYRKLLLATGASPRRLPVPGADAQGVHHLRKVEDSQRIKEMLGSVSRLVVIGAGWIGLEVTAAAREANVAVTVVELEELPLLAALGRELAEVFTKLHREHDVDFRFGQQATEISVTDGRASGVVLADGTRMEADAVLVSIGAAPNTDLAAQAGLTVDNGIVVDAALQSSDPDIVAAGDVANAFHPVLKRQIRVEHWQNAISQPVVAATTMLGKPASYDELPYFYTDQYDLGMEYLGDPTGYDRVVFRGDVDGREFIAFWTKENRVLAGMNVNVWDVGDPIKALILSGKAVDPAALADPDKALESLV
ncbi:NAD(P)/FAD-dependent oxidoreductase [Fodinicola acaciae]|uniref:NAD(P)/FAD-dependent oxidoreductase n=1 Tax=Fodinicola acaciae TaxID=2681555 RepID=UPI0013CF8EE6|nr:FAD-dependent oxidoreductase [Fodinicola acaciae]